MQPLLALLAVLAFLAAPGCGSSDDETQTQPEGGLPTSAAPAQTAPPGDTDAAPPGAAARECSDAPAGVQELRATRLSCGRAALVAAAWLQEDGCGAPAGASRGSCRLPDWLCASLPTARGEVVSCSRPGHSVAFLVRR